MFMFIVSCHGRQLVGGWQLVKSTNTKFSCFMFYLNGLAGDQVNISQR